MSDVDKVLDQILGGVFWMALLIPLGIFGISMLIGVFKKLWPQNAGGGFLHPDQIIMNRIFALGQNGGVRRIDSEKEMHVTVGLRGASIAVLGFACWWYFDGVTNGQLTLSYMDFVMMATIGYYVVFSWSFSVRYDHDRLWVRDWTFRKKEYDLRELDSMSEQSNGTWRLWFADGRKVEVLKFITQGPDFCADMKERIAHNVAKA
jgi:hypothetical protein